MSDNLHSYTLTQLQLHAYTLSERNKPYSGGYSTGVPPLPIPNREVKPGHVDGTAIMWESR